MWNGNSDSIVVLLLSIPPNHTNHPTPHRTPRHRFNNNNHRIHQFDYCNDKNQGSDIKINNQPRDDIDKIDAQEEKREN